MIQGYSPVMQAFLGTLFTWGLTACGASLVVVIRGSQRKVLDASLGFAAGVMTAASFWSLLSPAIELATESKFYGENGEYAWAPVALGFLLGSLFVYGADILISVLGVHSPNMMLALHASNKGKSRDGSRRDSAHLPLPDTTAVEGFTDIGGTFVHRRRSYDGECNVEEIQHGRWKRIMLLVVAITVHNIPEGLAVGVGFAATGSSSSANFETARNLALGIGIQNFPEGLAVSLPLHAAGFSVWKSLWYGQLSGMVEPIFGVLGAVAVSLAQPALPYALSFAAGAMIYVVVDDIIPEANTDENGKLATWGAVLGFLVMMTLDVGLG
ncbi:zinc transporter ZIP11 isoform X2 [Anthonomus grandis grandis]|uniref:zinc transporter ZIP11 isoform X2 n=1 Tax=Anthonomus grandis grandis TaxID=2921223 RepID=UPI00216649E7|nr:zinc transporter ZIP11 isoform X2 [Anthonomus grandis grandis]